MAVSQHIGDLKTGDARTSDSPDFDKVSRSSSNDGDSKTSESTSN